MLPTLVFHHKFKNDFEAVIRFEREPHCCPRLRANINQSLLAGIEDEYRAWGEYIEEECLKVLTASELRMVKLWRETGHKIEPFDPTGMQITHEQWQQKMDEQRKEMREGCQHQVDALLEAGWRFEPVNADSEPWQWYWRRPPRKRNSKGKLYLSTNQAYNALTKEKLNPA